MRDRGGEIRPCFSMEVKMKLPLSKRLAVCCDFIAPGDRVADIGCDHGYLSIHLLLEGIASSVIAADIRPGPLSSAVANSEKYGIKDRICFCLSDGVQSIPKDFDTLVCAGMGADTMIAILSAAPWLRSSQYRLILQCQSKTELLRRYLSDEGWRITEEAVLRDGRFLYTVMEVLWQPGHPRLTEGEQYFPLALLENPGKELPEYYQQVLNKLRRAVNARGTAADASMSIALKELEGAPALQWLKEK